MRSEGLSLRAYGDYRFELIAKVGTEVYILEKIKEFREMKRADPQDYNTLQDGVDICGLSDRSV